MLSERQFGILHAVLRDGSLTLGKVSEDFDISEKTARRDIRVLVDAELVLYSRGHLTATRFAGDVVHLSVNNVPSDALRQLGELAASCVRDGSIIFIAGGQADQMVASALPGRHDMVITNSLRVSKVLEQRDNMDLVVVGGVLRRNDRAIVGDVAVEFIKRFRADFAIIEAAEIDSDGLILGHDYLDANVTRAFIESARRVVVIFPEARTGTNPTVVISDVGRVDFIVSQTALSDDVRRMCERQGARILTPDQSNDRQRKI